MELADRVIAIVASGSGLAPEKISADSSFEELGIDSLKAMSIVFNIETDFGIQIPDERVAEVRTVGDLIAGLAAHLGRRNAGGS